MEDVWKDITLSSLQRHDTSSRGMILLDFFSGDPPPAAAAAVSPPPPPPPPQLPMPAMLTLSSGTRCQTRNPLADHPVISRRTLHSIQFENLVPADRHDAAGVGKKTFPESVRNSGDRRHKRMIKNRESAARSRARKQAYTNELELEVAHLLEENARLKKQQQQQWYEAAECHQHSKKKLLYRASTAPF